MKNKTKWSKSTVKNNEHSGWYALSPNTLNPRALSASALSADGLSESVLYSKKL